MTYKWEAIAQDLTEERDRLLKELEALRPDAERMKHLRKTAYLSGMGWMIGGSYPSKTPFAYNLKGKEAMADFNASVDASRAALNEPVMTKEG